MIAPKAVPRWRRTLGRRVSGLAALALFATLFGAAAPGDDPFAPCEEQVRADPEESAAYRCFYTEGRAAQRLDEAAARLARLTRANPGGMGAAWATLSLGHVAALGDPTRSIPLYREAAEAFSHLGRAKNPPPQAVSGEVQARFNLQTRLRVAGQTAAASAEVARALKVAQAGHDPLALGLALLADGIDHKGGDLGRARRSFRRAESLLFPDGPASQRSACLTELGDLAFRLGRYDDAISSYRRLLDLARTGNDHRLEANTANNLALTRQRQLESEPDPGGLDEVETWSRAALDGARREGLPEIEERSLQLLGEIARAHGHRDEARAALEASREIAHKLGRPAREASVLWSLAALTASTDPASAQRYSREAMRAALADGQPRTLAYSLGGRSEIDWLVRPREEAIRSSLDALSAIESLRTLQLEEEERVGLFSAWTQNYRWLAGKLLDGAQPDLPRAFEVMERMRGRFLLESLAAAGSPPLLPDPAAQEREEKVLTALAAVQLQLLDPELREAERAQRLAELERRELDLSEARAARGAADSPGTDVSVASLATVRRALGAHEALLLFQLGSWRDFYGDFAGGSWSIVLTRGGVRVHRLPDRTEIEALLPVFLGLLERRDGKEAPAAARLGEMLLGSVLRALPKSVDRLVIVPDGALYSLPWDALRTRREAQPLGLSFELALAPSATLFSRWRARPAISPSRGALVLADPERPYAERAATPRGAVAFSSIAEAARFGALPYARREGRDVAGLLPDSVLLTGDQATERALARIDLKPFAAIHFAAHAIADATHPDRSAVLLAPGGAADRGDPGAPSGAADGLLQPREIVALPLSGKLAVLSACRTADGAVISGEGTMSLARAFFQAGAATVIGSRWPLADDEAETLSKSFYRGLSAGKSAGSALRQARREAAAAGLPPAAWAGLVLMGDPAFALPLALQRPPRSMPGWAFGGAGVLLGIGAVIAAIALKTARARRATRRA